MSKLVQILLLSLQWFPSNGSPLLLQGISIKRSFDISLEPLPIKPLTFIKEKWSTFGVFRKKHTIQRRDLDTTALEDISQGSESVPVGLVMQQQSSLVVPHTVEGSFVYPDFFTAASVPPSNIHMVTVPSAPVSEETEPVTYGSLYIQPALPVLPQNILPQSTRSPPLLTTIVQQPAVSPSIVRPEFVPAAWVPPSPPMLEIVPSKQVLAPQPVLLPQPTPPPQIVPQQPVPPIKQPFVFSPVVASPLPSVPIIVPPEVAPTSPPQIVPLAIDKPTIPGSVLLPSAGQVPKLTSGTVQEMLPVASPPSINTVSFDNRSPDFFTNIFRVAPGLVNTPLGKRISPLIESNSIDGSANHRESTFIRRSKMALNLGNALLHVMSQFFSHARVTLDRLSNPPPIYLN